MSELSGALEEIDRIASKGDVNIQPLLMPIRDIVHQALENYKKQKPEAWIDEYGHIIQKLPMPIAGLTGTKFIPLVRR